MFQRRAIPALQFTRQSLILFMVAMSIVIALNLRVSAEKTYSGEMFFTAFPGLIREIDTLTATRGWPLPFLRYSKNMEFQTGDAELAAGWPANDRSVPLYTNVGRLIADIVIGLVMAVAWLLLVGVLVRALREIDAMVPAARLVPRN